MVASSPIARCRKPPTLALAYISPARSSKRRISIIALSHSRAGLLQLPLQLRALDRLEDRARMELGGGSGEQRGVLVPEVAAGGPRLAEGRERERDRAAGLLREGGDERGVAAVGRDCRRP